MVVPNGYVERPLLVTVATEQLSAVTGEPRTTPVATQEPAFAATETFTGHAIVGSCVSITVTTCVQVAVFPDPSATVQVTVVLPNE